MSSISHNMTRAQRKGIVRMAGRTKTNSGPGWMVINTFQTNRRSEGPARGLQQTGGLGRMGRAVLTNGEGCGQ